MKKKNRLYHLMLIRALVSIFKLQVSHIVGASNCGTRNDWYIYQNITENPKKTKRALVHKPGQGTEITQAGSLGPSLGYPFELTSIEVIWPFSSHA